MATVNAVAGNVVFVDFGRRGPVMLDKRRLARELSRSVRWIEMRQKEGMPSELRGNKRMYDLDEVRAWLNEREEAQSGREAAFGRS